jgi:WD40 repeat protein
VSSLSVSALNKNGNKVETVACDYTGESLLFADSIGNVFLALIYKNRFSTLATNSRCYALQFLDLNKLAFAIATYDKNVKVVNSAGKVIEVLKGHKSKVTNIQVNYRKELFFTFSKDSINLWNLKTFKRIRTLFPKKDEFSFAQFSPDSDYLITRFDVPTV